MTVEAGFADACHAATGGSPFLVGELGAALLAGGTAPVHANAARVAALGPRTVARSLVLRIGVALHAQALVTGPGPSALQDAVEVLERSSARLDHAHALVDLGASQRASGARSAAQATLRRGLQRGRACGATGLVRRAHEELIAAGARPRRLQFSGLEALTASERRIAELAAAGRSNREIAQRLLNTPRPWRTTSAGSMSSSESARARHSGSTSETRTQVEVRS